MNWDAIWYGILTGLAFAVAVAIVANRVAKAVKSVRQQPRFTVTVELDDGVSLRAVVDTSAAASSVINTYAPTALKPGNIR